MELLENNIKICNFQEIESFKKFINSTIIELFNEHSFAIEIEKIYENQGIKTNGIKNILFFYLLSRFNTKIISGIFN